MTYYEKITNKLENLNAGQDINVKIDDIDAKSITFSVYDSEVTEESLDTINEVLEWINIQEKGLNSMTSINYYPPKNGSKGGFNLRFELKVGEDYETEEEMHQRSLDDAEDRRSDFYPMGRGGGNDPSL